jgi:hypothetical protein
MIGEGRPVALEFRIDTGDAAMKAAITSTLVAGVLSLGVLAMLGGEALAQIKPEAGRPEAAPGLKERSERAPVPQRPSTPAPSEDAPALQDEMPVVPDGCPDQGRKLQLIV